MKTRTTKKTEGKRIRIQSNGWIKRGKVAWKGRQLVSIVATKEIDGRVLSCRILRYSDMETETVSPVKLTPGNEADRARFTAKLAEYSARN